MSSATIFISYRHEEPSTRIADALYTALSAVSDGMGFELVMDKNEIAPSDLFDQKILDGLNRTTHFLALLDNEYWASDYCRKELAHAVNRFENGEHVLLLFVMAGAIKPEYMTFDRDRALGPHRFRSAFRRSATAVSRSFQQDSRLERLKYEEPSVLDDQISGLIDQLERVLPAPPRR